MRRDAFDPCQAAHPLQALADRGKWAVADRRWKQVRVAGNLRLRFEHTDCGGPNRTNLRAALGIGKHDIAAIGVQPAAVHRLAFLTAIAGDRKSVVEGKRVSVRVDLGGRRILKKKTKTIKILDK